MEETMVMNAVEETTAIVPQQEAIPDTTGVDATTTEKSGKGKTAALIGGSVAAVAAMGGIAFGLVKHFRKKKAVTVEDPEPETIQKTVTTSDDLKDMSSEEFTAWVELFKAEALRRAALDKISEQPEKAAEEKTDDEPDNPEKTDDEPEQNNQEDQQQENTEPATKPDNKKKKGR